MVKSVEDEPEVTITHWGIMQDEFGFRLVGIRSDDRRGRVTSPIVEFDEHGRTARTESGRRYHLSGPPDEKMAAVLIGVHAEMYGLTVFDVAMAEPWEAALFCGSKPRGMGGVN